MTEQTRLATASTVSTGSAAAVPGLRSGHVGGQILSP